MKLKRLTTTLALVATATLLSAACGSNNNDLGGNPTCSPNDTRTCVGPGACKGGQTCGKDGTWGACDCGASGGSGGSSGSGGNGAGGAGSGGAPAKDGGGGSDSGAAGTSAGGAGGSASGDCPTNLPGPALVDVGDFCIDSTEVSVSQYQQFVKAKNGDMSGQPSICSGNTSYDIGCPQEPKGPNEPVRCISWCDASMYCAWAGKHLCGKIGGGAVTDAELKDPTAFEWMYACTQGGTTPYPYGGTQQNDACVTYLSQYKPTYPQEVQDVGSAATCRGDTAPFDAIYDMAGNVSEFVNNCGLDPVYGDIRCADRGSRASGGYDECAKSPPSPGTNAGDAWMKPTYDATMIGIRCCS